MGSCKITSSAAGAREGSQESYTAMRQILFSHLLAIIEWLGSEKPQFIRLQGTQMTDKRRPYFVPTEGIALRRREVARLPAPKPSRKCKRAQLAKWEKMRSGRPRALPLILELNGSTPPVNRMSA